MCRSHRLLRILLVVVVYSLKEIKFMRGSKRREEGAEEKGWMEEKREEEREVRGALTFDKASSESMRLLICATILL